MTIISSGESVTLSSGQVLSGAIVLSGGSLIVASGGAANGTILSGGSELVSANGIASGTTIAGGRLELANGAAASASGIAFSGTGGTLKIDGTTMPTTAIGGFLTGNTIDLAGVGLSAGGTVYLDGGNSLVVSTGYSRPASGSSSAVSGSTYSVGLISSPSFSSQSFRLVSDGSGGTNVTAAGGLSINLIYDPSVSGAPAQFTAGLQSAVDIFQTSFSNPVTLNINAGWGVVSGESQSSGAGGGASQVPSLLLYSGIKVARALASAGSQTSGYSAASFVSSLTPYLTSTFLFQPSEAQALNLGISVSSGDNSATSVSNNNQSLNGYIGLTVGSFGVSGGWSELYSSTPGNMNDLVGVTLHEISEVMGRVSYIPEFAEPSVIDLFRYADSGSRTSSRGGPNSFAYFSYDNGATARGYWNNYLNSASQADFVDWAPAGTPVTNDSYITFINGSPLLNSGSTEGPSPVSINDYALLNVMGWALSSSINPTSVGLSNTITVSSGQTVPVVSGLTLISSVVEGGGTLVVLSGAKARQTIVSSGGTEDVLAGGSADDTEVASGGTLRFEEGALAGGTTTVAAGGVLEVASGATFAVSSGQSDTGIVVLAGGSVVISPGGTASGTEVRSGGTINVVGGIDSGAIVSAGASTRVTAGADVGITVMSGAIETVLLGGTTSASILSNGGVELVSSGGVASGTMISSGGRENVLSGGTASGTLASSGGLELVSAGGVANGATILSGGSQSVLKLGVASNTTVISGGQALVSSGGTNRSTVASAGGQEIVSNGGTAGGTTIASGGAEIVSSGGTASNVTIESGGTQTVLRGGTAIGTVVSNGGTEVVSSATTRNTVISSGGQEVISAGGTASATVIGSGGSELVQSGGFLSGATISGGTLTVAIGGGALSSTITFAGGGSLVLDDTRFRGKIAGFAVPDTIDLTAVSFASSTLGYVGNAQSGTLTVSDGLNTVRLVMLGHYVAGNFHLTDDGHGGTLVSDPPLSSGSLASPH